MSHVRKELTAIGESEELIVAIENALPLLNDQFDSGAHNLGVNILKSLRVRFNEHNHASTFSVPKDTALYPFVEYLKQFPIEIQFDIIDYIPELFDYKCISPLTGADDEWFEVYSDEKETLLQNKRCGTVFKDTRAFNGQAYDLDGRLKAYPNFFHDSWSYYGTSGNMLKLIDFPYTPKMEYLYYHSEGDKILLEENFDTKGIAKLWHQLSACGIDPEYNTIINETVFMTKEQAEEAMEIFHKSVKHISKLEDRHSFYDYGDISNRINQARRLVGLLGYDYQQTDDGCYLIRGIKHEFRLAEVLMPNAHYQKWISLSRTDNSINTGPESHDILYAWVLEPVTPDHHPLPADYLYVDRLTDKIGQLQQYEHSLRTGIRNDIFVMIGGDTDAYLHNQRRKYGFAHPKRKMNRKFDEVCTVESKE